VERRNKIKETKYNNLYKNIMVEAVPGYLLEKQKKKGRSLVASYKCENEMKGGQHWRENERTCGDRCGSEEENIMHVLKECETTKVEMLIKEFLSEEGKNCNAMKRINRIREKRKKEEKERKAV